MVILCSVPLVALSIAAKPPVVRMGEADVPRVRRGEGVVPDRDGAFVRRRG